MMDLEKVKPYLATLPAAAFMIVLAGHLFGTLACFLWLQGPTVRRREGLVEAGAIHRCARSSRQHRAGSTHGRHGTVSGSKDVRCRRDKN